MKDAAAIVGGFLGWLALVAILYGLLVAIVLGLVALAPLMMQAPQSAAPVQTPGRPLSGKPSGSPSWATSASAS